MNQIKEKSSMRFWLMFALLVFAGVLVNWVEIGGEAKVNRKPLAEFPSQIGEWKQFGSDQRFDKETEAVLRADDYLLRDFILPDGRTANFYVGYYHSQKTGATYHSPQNCLPGSGWLMTEPEFIKIKTEDGKEFEANRYIIENVGQKALLIYWYQGRGHAVASEYWDKIYTIFDSTTRRRSDGSMVRIVMGIGKDQDSENETIKLASDFAGKIAPLLPNFIPN